MLLDCSSGYFSKEMALGMAGSSASRGTSEVSGITFSPLRTP